MIQISNVSYQYDGAERKCLDDVSLTVQDGEFVLLCGMSGCGKTTLTKMVNGVLLNLHSGMFCGEVTVNGMNIAESSMSDICRKVGSVFQNPRTQFYTLDTTSEIAFGCENLGMPREEIAQRVSQTVERFGLEKLAGRDIFGMSGGEKQRIALASIDAMDPEIYVLDEPSANLDTHAVEELRKILKTLKAQGKTILIAEHRIYYLADLIDRAVYMKDGRIVREYSRQELIDMSDSERLETGLRNGDLRRFVPERCASAWGDQRIVMSNVTFAYRKERILDIRSLRVQNGGVVAIVGENGAGKSTFVSVLAGLRRGAKGMFLLNSQPVSRKKRLRQSFMILQEVNHQLFTNSVQSEITLGCKDYSEDDLRDIMAKMHLTDFAEMHPATLSGGQKQRVVLCSAFFCGKKILFFDEPTSGLDYYHMMKTVQILNNLKQQGYFIFLITHDYELLLSVCDRVLILEHGRITDDYELTAATMPRLHRFLFPFAAEYGNQDGSEAC